MFDVSDRFLHQLAADRRASLQRSGEPRPAGPLRRAIGSALVRLGLRLGYDGSVAAIGSQLGTDAGPAVTAGDSPSVATSRTGGDRRPRCLP